VTSAFEPEFEGFQRQRKKRLPRWTGPAALGLIVLTAISLFVLRGPQIGVRDNDQKVISVVLPPPPPPPPPPPQQPKPPEPKPQITPPTPTPDTPPPPSQAPPQAQANDALTARQGAGPSNYGLAQGNGAGTRIGGGAGGDNGFGAYAALAQTEIARATGKESALHNNRFDLLIAVQVASDGRVAAVRVLNDAGKDPKRDAALQRLVGLQLSKPPPAGLQVMRFQLNTGSGA
jgi:type IV secretory pathway VirB10-like protein